MSKETFDTIMEWHKETFPDATLEGQLSKFEDELQEFMVNQNLEEYADLTVVACGIMRFDFQKGFEALYTAFLYAGVEEWTTAEMWEAVEKKMDKNRKRQWKKLDGKYQHKEEE